MSSSHDHNRQGRMYECDRAMPIFYYGDLLSSLLVHAGSKKELDVELHLLSFTSYVSLLQSNFKIFCPEGCFAN